MLTLLHPGWLWLLPLALLLLHADTLLHWTRRESLATTLQTPEQLARHPLAFLLQGLASSPRPQRGQRWLNSLAAMLLLLALSEPVLRGEKLPDPPQARDITFLIDTSVAMSLRDYVIETANGEQRIDRQTLLRQELQRMIDKLRGERMSLVVFGEHAYTLAPLSHDTELLKYQLGRVQTTVAGRFQAIGEAIALGVKQAQTDAQKARKRLLILLSPAREATGNIDAHAAALLAAEAGIPLYTVIIGAESAAAEEQRQSGLLYDTANRRLLESLAETTGALSFTAGSQQGLEQVLDDIARRESQSQEIAPRYLTQPLYFVPLALALLLITAAQLLSLREARA